MQDPAERWAGPDFVTRFEGKLMASPPAMRLDAPDPRQGIPFPTAGIVVMTRPMGFR